MKLFYLIAIALGFAIDTIYLGRCMVSYVKRKDFPEMAFDILPVFVLPAWGISGLMYFGKPPEEIQKVWNLFLIVLLLAFCVHLFICIGLPFLFTVALNAYHGRKLFDMSPLPNKKLDN